MSTFAAEILKSQFLNKILKLNKDYGFSYLIRPILCVTEREPKKLEVPDEMTFYFTEN